MQSHAPKLTGWKMLKYLLMILFSIFSHQTCWPMTPEEASKALLASLDYRMEPIRWRSEVTISGFVSDSRGRQDYSEKWHVRMDNGRHRVDPMPLSNWKSRLVTRATMCIGCFDDKTIAYYSTEIPNSALSIYGSEQASSMCMVDPRKIGLTTSELSGNQIGLRSFFTHDPSNLKTSMTEQGDHKIVAEKVLGYPITFELREYGGVYLPTKITFEYPMDGVEHRQVVANQYKQFEGRWMISSCHLEGYAGAVMKFEEKCDVVSLPFENHAETFTLKSMGVPKQTVVGWGNDMQPPGDAGTLYFDGETITSRVSFQEPSPASRWFLGFNGAMIVAGVLIFLWQLNRNRSKYR